MFAQPPPPSRHPQPPPEDDDDDVAFGFDDDDGANDLLIEEEILAAESDQDDFDPQTLFDEEEEAAEVAIVAEIPKPTATIDDAISNPESVTLAEAAETLRTRSSGCRVSFRKPGTSKALNKEVCAAIGIPYNADGDYIKAGKKLFNTESKEWKDVTKVRGMARKYWEQHTLCYTEPGIRLIRNEDIPQFVSVMQGFQVEHAHAVAVLQIHYENIKLAQRAILGDLFDEDDYPARIDDCFSLTWDFPNLTPSPILMTFGADLYAREQTRIQQRFEAAVSMADDFFHNELLKLVDRLQIALGVDEEGKPRVIKESHVDRLTEFIDRFKNLSVGSDAQLAALTKETEALVGRASVSELRSSSDVRLQLQAKLDDIANTLAAGATKQRRRVIDLPATTQSGATNVGTPAEHGEHVLPTEE